MILRDLSLGWVYMHCVFMFMFLYESRYTKKVTNIVTAAFVTPLILLNLWIIMKFGTEAAAKLIFISCVLPSFIFFFIMSKTRDARFLFTFCVVDTIIMEVATITNLLDTFLGFGNYIVMFVSRILIIPVIEFLIVKYLRTPYRFLQKYTKKGWGVFSILGVLFYATMLITINYPSLIFDRPEYYPYLIILLILIPVMYLTVFDVLWKQIDLFHAEEKNRMLDLQIKMARERLLSNMETENRLKIIKHDMKHKLLLLSDYIKNNKLDKAEEYINGIIEDINMSSVKSYCSNNSVNVVLSYYDRIAEKNGVKFETSICLPEEIPINDTDLTVILSNGLENAINALKACDDKKIIIKCFIEDKKIYLEIKNPFKGNIIFDENLPQSNRKNHGYGTRSMAAVVENNDGIYCFVIENGFFVFRCAI